MTFSSYCFILPLYFQCPFVIIVFFRLWNLRWEIEDYSNPNFKIDVVVKFSYQWEWGFTHAYHIIISHSATFKTDNWWVFKECTPSVSPTQIIFSSTRVSFQSYSFSSQPYLIWYFSVILSDGMNFPPPHSNGSKQMVIIGLQSSLSSIELIVSVGKQWLPHSSLCPLSHLSVLHYSIYPLSPHRTRMNLSSIQLIDVWCVSLIPQDSSSIFSFFITST